jgi:hypothetical protein
VTPTAATTPASVAPATVVSASEDYGAAVYAIIVTVRIRAIGIDRAGIWITDIGAPAVGAVGRGGREHVGDYVFGDSGGAEAFHIGLAQDIDGIGFIHVMDDEAGRDGALGESDDVIERERIAIDHLLVHIHGDVVGLENGLVLTADGLATGEEDRDEEQGEKTEAFHGRKGIG